jgi:hypothetical protein
MKQMSSLPWLMKATTYTKGVFSKKKKKWVWHVVMNDTQDCAV